MDAEITTSATMPNESERVSTTVKLSNISPEMAREILASMPVASPAGAARAWQMGGMID